MKLFYYAQTGHRIGLDRFRRAAAMIECLEDVDIRLLTSDYRIASVAREYGVKECVGIDVARNIANIAQRGDKLIFDSDEANPLMLEDMRSFFSVFVRIIDDKEPQRSQNEYIISPYYEDEQSLKSLMIAPRYFGGFKKDIPVSFFFGDDDYEKDLQKHLDFIDGIDLYLQLGFYYFLAYEDMLRERFDKIFEFEEYDQMVQRTDILITSSPQTALESLASGGRPIYFQREDYSKDLVPLLQELGIPTIFDYDKKELNSILENISDIAYKKVENNCYKTKNFLKNILNL
ncbi:hypothetical protein MNB_SM-7-62 [hydrothermal vent metagenome]|uniref:Uncharacterized protein n=1 Tax=hydrothermal vent metagenome TaxID=652676 RepID=A0A1W1BI01_9ZZZZ